VVGGLSLLKIANGSGGVRVALMGELPCVFLLLPRGGTVNLVSLYPMGEVDYPGSVYPLCEGVCPFVLVILEGNLMDETASGFRRGEDEIALAVNGSVRVAHIGVLRVESYDGFVCGVVGVCYCDFHVVWCVHVRIVNDLSDKSILFYKILQKKPPTLVGGGFLFPVLGQWRGVSSVTPATLSK
jgi:hypothetical protein